MPGLFLKLLNMSVSAGWLILAVVLVRAVFRKAPKWFNCLLWALVAVRLICPFSIESRLSLVPEAEIVNTAMDTGRPYIRSGITTVDNTVNTYLGEHYNEDVTAPVKESVKPVAAPIQMITIVWMIGAFGFLLYAFTTYLHLRRRVSESVRFQENIFLCDRIQTPFILGIVKPRIFLPFNMDELQMENVIAHEQAHISRKDYLWKPLGYILLAVYWFQPLCILAYILLCRDIEMACDEKVIRNMDAEAKKEYSRALLSCSVSGKMISACPLAFGEVGVKERIKCILNYKRPTLWILIVSALICVVAAICFLTNPESNVYKVGIRIPAHSEVGFYYSDSEISPQKRTIFFEVGQEVGDTEVQILPVEVTEENAYDESTYVTPGMPSKVKAEKGAWFRIGIYAGNESDEDITIYVTVSNVEVRIASAEQPLEAEQKETGQSGRASQGTDLDKADLVQSDTIEVKAPTIDLEAPTGANGSMLYYADQEKFIFGGCYGLFVYDLTNREIVRSVDLAPIGCNMTQGDEACEINVTEDGMTVFLHPMNQEQMYVYQVAENTMVKEPYDLKGYDLYHNQYNGEEKGKYASYEKDGETRYIVLVNDMTIGELGYTPDEKMSSYYLIFGDQKASYDRAFEIVDRVVGEVGLENAYAWNNTAEFKEDADVLIKMAVDSTGEYEVYGIISAEYGAYGMLLNDIIDGEDNWNFVYEPWMYTGAPGDQPALEWDADGELVFSYVYVNEDGEERRYHRVVDCGYDTGHMELLPAAEANNETANGYGDRAQDSKSDGAPSPAYIDYLQEQISAAMTNGELPFVTSSAVMENPLRLEVRVKEMSEENIEKLRSYETMGEAITIVESEGENKLEELGISE